MRISGLPKTRDFPFFRFPRPPSQIFEFPGPFQPPRRVAGHEARGAIPDTAATCERRAGRDVLRLRMPFDLRGAGAVRCAMCAMRSRASSRVSSAMRRVYGFDSCCGFASLMLQSADVSSFRIASSGRGAMCCVCGCDSSCAMRFARVMCAMRFDL